MISNMIFGENRDYITHDDYMTPRYAFENIKDYIPKKVIWEPFYGDGTSGEILRDLGFEVIHEPIDFFENDLGEVIVSNPPFSQYKEILNRLMILDKPFILILPSAKLCTSTFRKYKDKFQIIIPPKRIHFKKLVGGKPIEGWKNACYFDCFYYCYKIGLPRDIVWLES
jgi:hypothetical protein